MAGGRCRELPAPCRQMAACRCCCCPCCCCFGCSSCDKGSGLPWSPPSGGKMAMPTPASSPAAVAGRWLRRCCSCCDGTCCYFCWCCCCCSKAPCRRLWLALLLIGCKGQPVAKCLWTWIKQSRQKELLVWANFALAGMYNWLGPEHVGPGSLMLHCTGYPLRHHGQEPYDLGRSMIAGSWKEAYERDEQFACRKHSET